MLQKCLSQALYCLLSNHTIAVTTRRPHNKLKERRHCLSSLILLRVPEFDGVGELVDGHEEVLDDPLLSHMHPTHQTLLCDNNSGSSV